MAARVKFPASPSGDEKYIRVIEFEDFCPLFTRLFCPLHRKVVKLR